jgi:hypothetical protein
MTIWSRINGDKEQRKRQEAIGTGAERPPKTQKRITKEFEGSINISMERTRKVGENPTRGKQLYLEYAEDDWEEVLKDFDFIMETQVQEEVNKIHGTGSSKILHGET